MKEYKIEIIPQGWKAGFQSATIQRDGKLGRHQVTQVKENKFMGAVGYYNGGRLPIYNREQSPEFDSINEAIKWCDGKAI